jgi:hypothetical protein
VIETNPEEMKFVVAHEEVPKGEASVKTARTLKEWYRDQHLAVGHRRHLKEWTQDDSGSQKKLAAHRGMTHHCTPALPKGHGQGPDRDIVVRGAPKGQMLERR